jgi:hypothetical protein
MECIRGSGAKLAAQEIESEKSKVAVILRDQGSIALHNLPMGRKMNGQFFSDGIPLEPKRVVMAITKNKGIAETLIHADD